MCVSSGVPFKGFRFGSSKERLKLHTWVPSRGYCECVLGKIDLPNDVTNNILNGEKSARSDKEEIDDDSSNGNTSSDSGEFNSFFVIKTIYTNLIMLFIIFLLRCSCIQTPNILHSKP